MGAHKTKMSSRRTFLRSAAAAATALILTGSPHDALAAGKSKPLKIGIIGAGRIGGTLGELWVKAGHEVLLSSRHPERLKGLAKRLGPRARAGTPRQAAAFGDVVLVSVPYHATPQIGRDFAAELAGKIVLDTGNPFPGRDGEMALAARAKGAGLASAEFLPGVRLVRAFNSVGHYALRSGRTAPASVSPSPSPATTKKPSLWPRGWCATPVSSRSWSALFRGPRFSTPAHRCSDRRSPRVNCGEGWGWAPRPLRDRDRPAHRSSAPARQVRREH